MKTLSLHDLQQDMRDFAVSRVGKKLYDVPDSALPVATIGSVQAPNYGAANQVQIITYTVRANWACLIRGIVLGWKGSGTAPLPGDVIFSIDIDRPVGSLAGYPEKDYGLLSLTLGSFDFGITWPVQFRHRDGEQIRVKAYTVANMGVGPGNFLTAALLGWEWPEETDL